jgi:hypothetical protein
MTRGDVDDGATILARDAQGRLFFFAGAGAGTRPGVVRNGVRTSTVSEGNGWHGSLLTTIGDWIGDGRTEFLFRNRNDQVLLYRGSSSGFPSNGPETIISSEGGPYVTNLIGMGDLTSDAVIDGEPVTQPLPDVIVHEDDYLFSRVVDADDDFDPIVGTGWSGYRLF